MVERIGNEDGDEFGGRAPETDAALMSQLETGVANQPNAQPEIVEARSRVVVEMEQSGILRLPANSSIDLPQINGSDLEFVQADGTVIVVPGGAVQGLTILIGNIEIPPLAVAALFEANNIETAAGPGASGARSSGGNFEVPIGGIGNAFAIGNLLAPTELAFADPQSEDLYPGNNRPSLRLSEFPIRLSEEGLALGLDDGLPLGLDSTDDNFFFIDLGASDPDNDPLTFTLGLPNVSLTSGGQSVVWSGVGTNHLIGKVGTETVIDITVGGKTGIVLIQLLKPIDHPDGDIEDVITMGVRVTVSDGRGGTASAMLNIGIEDDSPIAGNSAQTVNLDEDGLDTSHASGIGNSNSPGDNAGNAVSGSGTLGIRWGADNGDMGADAVVDGHYVQDNPAAGGRAVFFTNANVLINGHDGASLSSNGDKIAFALSADGTRLIGTAGEGEGQRVVIEVSLSDDGTGGYAVKIYDNLDHARGAGEGSGEGDGGDAKTLASSPSDGDSVENDISLTFNITARDSDGDTSGGTFTVIVGDDMPVLVKGRGNVHTIDEDDIYTRLSLGTSPNDGTKDGSYTGNPANNGVGPAYVYGSLANVVNFGADGPGGFAIIEAAAIEKFEAYDLSSKGKPLSYNFETGENGETVLVATAAGRKVFEFSLDAETGEYAFRLHDQLDHDAPGDDHYDRPSQSDENFDLQDGLYYADVFALDFGSVIRAFDGDGDYVDLEGKLSIKVRDDVPELVKGRTETKIVDEQEIDTKWSDGTKRDNAPDANGDNNDSHTGDNGASTVSGSLAHLVKSGADESLKFSFVSNATSKLADLGLNSKGAELQYVIQGKVLIAYVEQGGFAGFNAHYDRPVFKLTLDKGGDYKFELFDQLDHHDGNGESHLLEVPGADIGSIAFGQVIKATDHDGDSVLLKDAFKIQVRDDVPVLVKGARDVQIVDEDDIYNEQAIGTSPNDGPKDGSSTGNPANNGMGPASVLGSFANSVNFGADEPGRFEIRVASAIAKFTAYGLTSDGVPLSYSVMTAKNGDSVFVATAGDRKVFEFSLDPLTGEYAFRLHDRLDHDAPADDRHDAPTNSDANFDLSGQPASQ